LRRELHVTQRIYCEVDARLHELGPQGYQAEVCWSVLPVTIDDFRLCESAYCRASKLEDPWSLQ
jgi:hypothetical protein